MSKIITELNPKIYLELTEGEAGALDAICSYELESFLSVFKEKLGNVYIKQYEDSLPSLFDKARKLGHAISQLKRAHAEIKVINC
jgi:hypothetical protein